MKTNSYPGIVTPPFLGIAAGAPQRGEQDGLERKGRLKPTFD